MTVLFFRRLNGAGIVRHGRHNPLYRPQVGVFLPGGWGVIVTLRPHPGWQHCHGLPHHRPT